MSDLSSSETQAVCPLCGYALHFENAESLIGQAIRCPQCDAVLEMDSGEVPDGELGYFLLNRSDVRKD